MSPKQKPANEKLATPLGGILDKLSYATLSYIIFGIIVGCALYYWLADGTNKSDLSFGNSLYFSITTFTSLGYGEIVPVGFGKVISSLEVLSGLVFIALLVGKLASERQAALLLLIYTSDQQRRLGEFELNLDTLTETVETALEEHDTQTLNIKSRSAYDYVSSIHKYLQYHSNQGQLASYGNFSALQRLYNSFLELQQKAFEAIQTSGTTDRAKTNFEWLINKMDDIADAMKPFHEEKEKAVLLDILEELKSSVSALKKWNKMEKNQHSYKHRNQLNEPLLQRVKNAMPPTPWERHIHKKIAEQLNLTSNLAHKCINELVNRGTWPGAMPKDLTTPEE
jgi:hypothetical protein